MRTGLWSLISGEASPCHPPSFLTTSVRRQVGFSPVCWVTESGPRLYAASWSVPCLPGVQGPGVWGSSCPISCPRSHPEGQGRLGREGPAGRQASLPFLLPLKPQRGADHRPPPLGLGAPELWFPWNPSPSPLLEPCLRAPLTRELLGRTLLLLPAMSNLLASSSNKYLLSTCYIDFNSSEQTRHFQMGICVLRK